jgi:hypothetical protein
LLIVARWRWGGRHAAHRTDRAADQGARRRASTASGRGANRRAGARANGGTTQSALAWIVRIAGGQAEERAEAKGGRCDQAFHGFPSL